MLMLNHIVENGEGLTITDDGRYRYYQSSNRGELHRVDGPAFMDLSMEYYAWYQDGKRHRVDGPAIVRRNGLKDFFYHGVDITEEIKELGYQDADPEFLRTMIPLIAAGKNQ